MIIDGHAHSCGSYKSVRSIKKHLNKYEIDKVVLCGGEPDSNKDYNYPVFSNFFKGDKLAFVFNKLLKRIVKISNLVRFIDEENIRVYKIASLLPKEVINVYWVNPLDERFMEKLNCFYKKYDFKMLKLHQCWTKFDIKSEKFIKIVKWADRENIPIFIHFESKNQVMDFINIINKYKSVNFICAHMIGIRCMIEKIDKMNTKNIYFDLSSPQLYSIESMENAKNHFGVEKLILGSDTPYGKNNIKIIYKRLRKLKVNQSEIDLICGENLSRLLSI